MKKAFAITITSFLLPALASAATLSVSPSSQSVNVGDTFTVSINLDTQGASVDGVDLRYLNYNPSLLQVQGTKITPGSLMPMTLANTVDANNGRITFSQVSLGGNKYSGSGTLATVTFKALSSGTANLSFDYTQGKTTDSNVAANGADVLSAVVNGSFTVGSGGSASSGGGGGSSSGGGGGGGGGSSSGTTGSFSPYGSIASSGGGSTGCAPGLSIPQINSVVGRGSSGDSVTNLQKFLVQMGYTTADNITGYFGPVTEAALQRFQAAQGIVSSGDPLSTGYGNAGPSTRARINMLIATTVPSTCGTQTIPVAVSGTLTRALGRGSSGDEVRILQQFLVSQGFTTADNVTGYFGPVTQTAVQAFQRAQGIVSSGDPVSTGYGNVGPSTRARINSMLGSSFSPAQTSGTSNDLQAQINAMQQQVQELMLKIQNSQ